MSALFFLISKLLPVPFYPVGLAVTLSISAIVLTAMGKTRVAVIVFSVSTGVVLLFSSPFVAHMLARPLESKYEQKDSYPPAGAIVLLTGGEVPPLPPRHFTEINSAGDRILHAVRLLKGKATRRLVITGGKIPMSAFSRHSVSSITASLITELFDVPDKVIVLEEEARNTAEHGVYVRKLFDRNNWSDDIILVTSALHMDRSVKVFKKYGFNVHPAPTDYRTNERFNASIMHFLPDASSLELCTSALHEYYGIIAYKLLGKL